jgi:hypothetical protein
MKKYLLLIFIFISSNIYSEGPKIGIRLELSFLNSNEYGNVSPLNLYVNLRQLIIENTNIKFNLGLSFYAEEYGGLSYSLLIENEFYKNIKVIGGINYLQNGGVSHGTSVYTETYSNTFFHYVVGVGINLSKDTSIDMLLLLPNKKEFGFSRDAFIDKTSFKNLNNIIKLGMEYYF